MPSLLDTNVISELPKPQPHPNVLAYFSRQPMEQLFLSTVTLAEIRYGILLSPDRSRKQQLQEWLDHDIRIAFQDRVLPVTETVLLRWRVLLEQGRKSGRPFSQPDLILAATALEHDFTLVTRNTRDFGNITGLQLLNPWESHTARFS